LSLVVAMSISRNGTWAAWLATKLDQAFSGAD